jgi:hypothetical protein
MKLRRNQVGMAEDALDVDVAEYGTAKPYPDHELNSALRALLSQLQTKQSQRPEKCTSRKADLRLVHSNGYFEVLHCGSQDVRMEPI